MEEEGERERGGPTVRRKRERGRGVVPPCGGRGRRGERWSHREEEEAEGERGGTTVWRRREEGRGVVPPCGRRGRGGCSAFVRSPLASLGAAWGREEEVQHL